MFAAIQLENYYIKRIDFKYEPYEEEKDDKDIKFGHNIRNVDKSKAEVTITCNINSKNTKLKLKVMLVGIFKVNPKMENNQLTRKALRERNTLAILFPYLRSAVSDISLKANINPIILPTLNIVALLDEAKENKKNKNQSKTV